MHWTWGGLKGARVDDPMAWRGCHEWNSAPTPKRMAMLKHWMEPNIPWPESWNITVEQVSHCDSHSTAEEDHFTNHYHIKFLIILNTLNTFTGWKNVKVKQNQTPKLYFKFTSWTGWKWKMEINLVQTNLFDNETDISPAEPSPAIHSPFYWPLHQLKDITSCTVSSPSRTLLILQTQKCLISAFIPTMHLELKWHPVSHTYLRRLHKHWPSSKLTD